MCWVSAQLQSLESAYGSVVPSLTGVSAAGSLWVPPMGVDGREGGVGDGGRGTAGEASAGVLAAGVPAACAPGSSSIVCNMYVTDRGWYPPRCTRVALSKCACNSLRTCGFACQNDCARFCRAIPAFSQWFCAVGKISRGPRKFWRRCGWMFCIPISCSDRGTAAGSEPMIVRSILCVGPCG